MRLHLFSESSSEVLFVGIRFGKIINLLKSTASMKRAFVLILIIISFFTGNSQSIKKELFDEASVKMSEIMTNTIRSDFGPTLIGDSLYFSSFRDAIIEKSDKELKEKEFYDLFKAGIDVYGNVISARQPLEEFITRFHDGPISWCQKTGELFVTQSNYVAPLVKYQPFRNEDIKLRIVIAKKVNDKWTVVEEFPFNKAEYSVGHPAINATGDTLVFASDMPGGFGATDLYMSVRKNGIWNAPSNLGSDINTSGKDEFPFLTGSSFPERFLIFASTGHNSKGGLDLFYKKLNDPKSEVIQFPEPINSTSDDFSMTLPDNKEFGYMTSNRQGTGNDDIYRITFIKDINYLLEILVADKKSLKPIPGAQVKFGDIKTSLVGSDGLASLLFKKNAVVDIAASAFGYKNNNLKIEIGTPKQGIVLRDTILLDMIVDEKITLKNIYYDFDKWDILPESAKELDQLVSLTKENPTLKVELGSHTDARGSKQYNLKLSQLRAQAAVDYVISKGIDKLMVKGIGYGESQLINGCSDGIQCTPAQHRENRRTELLIPGFLKGEHVIQEIGDYSDGKPDHGPKYNSYKQHGSIYERTTNVAVGVAEGTTKASSVGTDETVSTGSKELEVSAFYLIMGSFQDEINANQFIQKLKADGVESKILTGSKPFRVGLSFTYFSQAKKALEDLKSKSHVGWIIQGN